MVFGWCSPAVRVQCLTSVVGVYGVSLVVAGWTPAMVVLAGRWFFVDVVCGGGSPTGMSLEKVWEMGRCVCVNRVCVIFLGSCREKSVRICFLYVH